MSGSNISAWMSCPKEDVFFGGSGIMGYVENYIKIVKKFGVKTPHFDMNHMVLMGCSPTQDAGSW